jgi:hypothetical protein
MKVHVVEKKVAKEMEKEVVKWKRCNDLVPWYTEKTWHHPLRFPL